jgi:hypothetical protein
MAAMTVLSGVAARARSPFAFRDPVPPVARSLDQASGVHRRVIDGLLAVIVLAAVLITGFAERHAEPIREAALNDLVVLRKPCPPAVLADGIRRARARSEARRRRAGEAGG